MYNLGVVHARLLGTGLITIRREYFGDSSGIPQTEFFRPFTGGADEGLLKDANVNIKDRLNGNSRQCESFWQYELENLAFQERNIRQVEE